MIRVHAMPFGAALSEAGVRFALWAPSAAEVDLIIGDEAPRAMNRREDGQADLFVAGARAGTRYAFRVNGRHVIPDPASRFQPDGALAASMVVDPASYQWRDEEWRGRAWEEAVIWEAHVGAATPTGSYEELARKLPDLAHLGFTAIELMPLSDCPGERNWGYDGVLPFSPNRSYGWPDDLKRLIDRAHELNLMMFLDVVYNHFGPSGNFLSSYCSSFFNESEVTPWGGAINFDGPGSAQVRDFFIHNALYWLEELHFDGLRFDAVHAFVDHSERPFLADLAARVRAAIPNRRIHLILENEKNEAHWLARREDGTPAQYTAQWDDDVHHCWHRLLTGEQDGYYEDFDQPARRLGRALAEGFAYQGEPSRHQSGRARGEPSSKAPPAAFVAFLQNHDQIGNRAFGERIGQLAPEERLDVALALLLLSPQIPMMFMGEEWGASAPFLYFVDFSDDPSLSKAVREGRRREFARFPAFSDQRNAERIPDPTAPRTFLASKIDWEERKKPLHAARLAAVAELLRIRAVEIVPLISTRFVGASHALSEHSVLTVEWRFAGAVLRLIANFGGADAPCEADPSERLIWASSKARVDPGRRLLPSWSAALTVRTDASA